MTGIYAITFYSQLVSYTRFTVKIVHALVSSLKERIIEPSHEKTNNLPLCKNKDADQCLCFHYTDSTSPLLKSEISSFQPASETVQASLCRTWLKTEIVGFLMQWLRFLSHLLIAGCDIGV